MVLSKRLKLDVQAQPDDTTCGPTCLHAVYRFYGDPIPLEQVIDECEPLETGGTLAVCLACHALRRGFDAKIYTYNLEVFDPTWFGPDGRVKKDIDLSSKLAARLDAKRESRQEVRLRADIRNFLDFLELGGRVRFEDLTPAMIRNQLAKGRPLLTGLSATFLYRSMRQWGPKDADDDVQGDPAGHFVVLCGYYPRRREVLVADPLEDNPPFLSHKYTVGIDRLVGAILLGVLTYDANLLVIEPREKRAKK